MTNTVKTAVVAMLMLDPGDPSTIFGVHFFELDGEFSIGACKGILPRASHNVLCDMKGQTILSIDGAPYGLDDIFFARLVRAPGSLSVAEVTFMAKAMWLSDPRYNLVLSDFAQRIVSLPV